MNIFDLERLNTHYNWTSTTDAAEAFHHFSLVGNKAYNAGDFYVAWCADMLAYNIVKNHKGSFARKMEKACGSWMRRCEEILCEEVA